MRMIVTLKDCKHNKTISNFPFKHLTLYKTEHCILCFNLMNNSQKALPSAAKFIAWFNWNKSYHW